MYTISQIAKKFGLSRSTLLYYDKIGLLSPKQRTDADYRLYSEADCKTMEEIARLRGAGVGLGEIRKLLEGGRTKRTDILRERLAKINHEISLLRHQQRFILNLLGDRTLMGGTRVLTKDKWIGYLRRAGLDEAGMNRWHQEFEASSPEAHQDFLESLGLSDSEIRRIRQHSSGRK